MNTQVISLNHSVYSRVVLPFLVLLLFFVLTTPENHSEAEDVFMYALKVEQGDLKELFHPSHLIHLPLIKGIYLIARELGLAQRAYPLMVFLSSIFGSLTVIVFTFLLKKRLKTPNVVSIIGGALLATSYGFWRYSCEAEVYIIACFVILMLLYYAFDERTTYTTSVLSGALAALSYLLHSFSMIPAFIVVPLFFLLRKKVRYLVVYGLVALSIILLCYYIAFQITNPADKNFLHFFRGAYKIQEHLTIKGIIASIAKGFFVFSQNIVSGNFLFSYYTFQEAISKALPYRMLEEEKFMGGNADAISKIVPPFTLSMLVALTLTSAFFIRKEIARIITKIYQEKQVIAILVWLLIYIVLVLPFEPDAPELWIIALLPFWLVVTRFFLVPLYKKKGVTILIILLLLLGVHNYIGGFNLIAGRETDYNYQKARWLIQNAGVEDVVLTAERAGFSRYLRYYYKGSVVDLQEFSNIKLGLLYKGLKNVSEKGYADEFSAIYQQLNTIHGEVYATAELFDPPKYLQYSRPKFYGGLRIFDKKTSNNFKKIFENAFGGIYVKSD